MMNDHEKAVAALKWLGPTLDRDWSWIVSLGLGWTPTADERRSMAEWAKHDDALADAYRELLGLPEDGCILCLDDGGGFYDDMDGNNEHVTRPRACDECGK